MRKIRKRGYQLPRRDHVLMYSVDDKPNRKSFLIGETKIKREDREFYQGFTELCERQLKQCDDLYYMFGYETFGTILYGFCKWLIRDLKNENIENILFFSRDGYIMKRAFELVPGHEDFTADYIHVSRRSLRVPLLWKYDRASVSELQPTAYISMEDLLVSVGLEPDTYAERLEKSGLHLNAVIKDTDIECNDKVVCFLQDIWPDVVSNSKKEYESLTAYLEQLNIPSKVAVIDIGWRGTMQYFLGQDLDSMGKNIHLRGYYITLSSSMKRGIDIHGFLQNVDGTGNGCDLLRGYVGLIETLFLKPEGSAKKYEIAPDGHALPVLFDCEYRDEGDALPMEIAAVQKIQEGALQFIRDHIACVREAQKELSFSSETAFASLNRFGNHPTLRELKMFSHFRFYNGTTTYLAEAKPVWHYLRKPKELKQDFYGCRWRTGFMKNLFKLPLPYYTILQTLVKLTVRSQE